MEGCSLRQTLGPTFSTPKQGPKLCALTAATQASKQASGDCMEGNGSSPDVLGCVIDPCGHQGRIWQSIGWDIIVKPEKARLGVRILL